MIFNYESGWSKFHLKLFGLWPEKDEKKINNYWGFIHAFGVLIGLEIPRLFVLVILWNDINVVAQSLSTHVPFAMAISKMLILSIKRKELSDIVESMKNDWNEKITIEEFKEINYYVKYSHHVSIISAIVAWLSITTGFISQEIFDSESRVLNKTDPRLYTKGVWVIAAVSNKLMNNLTFFFVNYCVQLYASVVGPVVYTITDSVIVTMIMHLCGQLTRVKIKLKNICNESGDYKLVNNNFNIKLKNIIKLHEKLETISKKINNCFGAYFFLETIGCTVTLCVQGFFIITIIERGEFNIFQLIFPCCLQLLIFSHLFIHCYVCQMLNEFNAKIGYTIYESDWTVLNYKNARTLLIIGYKQFKPTKMGYYNITMDLSLFLTIIRSSLSYLSVLLAMKNN